jgi:RNA polymerase sigma-70 factor, ECF subfamily
LNVAEIKIESLEHSPETLRLWIEQAKLGNEEAFSSLIIAFAPKLQAILYRILLDWEETLDVSQETFIAIYRALPRYKDQGKFQSWLFQIGVRRAYDVLRKRKRHPMHRIEDENEPLAILDKLQIREVQAEKNELTRAIEEAVSYLPPDQRTSFILAEYEGHSYQEIAKIIGGSAKRVEMHLYHARKLLRERLKSYLN